jgi:hypothetical protein
MGAMLPNRMTKMANTLHIPGKKKMIVDPGQELWHSSLHRSRLSHPPAYLYTNFNFHCIINEILELKGNINMKRKKIYQSSRNVISNKNLSTASRNHEL